MKPKITRKKANIIGKKQANIITTNDTNAKYIEQCLPRTATVIGYVNYCTSDLTR